ncbi:Ribosomal N-lysine methyltransferase set10 [Phytophthora nicotianae]|uniref:Ribosomal N-lysine methyltransferase set10 n=1 Tax=Phytophthora nicotianae TaxID=4792 RepID=A0A0W8CD61_PHYNI|nr:Ribosomal N-lysine methyltransferase set10 [Phytophthora nicotianae]
MAPEHDESVETLSGDAFVGYNEWAAETLKVRIATDFVYETQDGACASERGVFIAEDVTPHTEVFSIPLDSVLSVKSLQEISALQNIAFFQQLTPEREDDQLALALLYEKFVQGDKSKWAKHIELLPKTYHNALYFEQEEIKALEGSNLFFIAQQMEKKVAADYTSLKETVLLELFENITEGITVDLFDDFFSLDNYKWALSTIWSRFVSLRLDEAPSSKDSSSSVPVAKQSFKAMVPVFDMLNHDPEAEMSHFFDMDTQLFKLVSHQHWNAGTQMFINYGPLSNHKLLLLYGFVIIGNPFDAVEMWLPMDEASTKFYLEKEQFLLINGLDHATNPFELVAEETNDLLLMATRIQEIDCETVEEFEILANKALDGEMVSLENEQEALTRLIYTLEKMLETFPTSIEEDDELLESWEDDLVQQGDEQSDTLNHERMAVAVRRSDKYILTENISMLKWKLLDILPQN